LRPRCSERLLAALVAWVITLSPAVVLACPNCAAARGYGPLGLAVMAAFVLFPFGVVLVLWPLLKRLGAPMAPPEPGRSWRRREA
jgi:hypothetical protein